MKAVKLAAGLLLVLSIVFSPAVLVQLPSMIHVEAHQAGLDHLSRGMITELDLKNDTFFITETGEIQPLSHVAYGGGHHVVVYVKENKDQFESIHATVIPDQADGQIEGYLVSNQDADYGHPAIAYLGSSELFIIAYSHDQMAIYVQAFSSTIGNIGPAVLISEDEVDKGFPAIACNHLDDVCLVAFQQSGTHIKGSYIEVSHDGVVSLSAAYDLVVGNEIDQPRLAWGRGEGTFLLTYNERHASGEVRPSYIHVDDHGDPLVLNPSEPLIPDELIPPGHDAFVTDAAFDPCTETFVLTIVYDSAGDGSDFDLWAAVVDASDPIIHGVFPIAESSVSEHGGAIRLITADHVFPACGEMNRLVVAYINAADGLLATELRGNSNPSDPSYAVDPVDLHLVIAGHTNMYQISSVSLSGGSMDGQVLVVYERHFPFSENFEIWGRFLSQTTSSTFYLPLVMR